MIQIHKSSNIVDLKTIIMEHYQLNEDDLAALKDKEFSDPMQMKNMKKCIDILKRIKQNGEKILVCGDYDCDGICATTILCKAFKAAKMQYGFYIPDRLHEGYGLSVETLRKAKEKGYHNIITVDNGVKAHEAMEYAKENKMCLIISDHHTYEENEINCDCFLHPFLEKNAFTNCCGAGIALQIARCIIPNDREIVALAALATIADCMDVTLENRKIIQKGIEYLNAGACPPLHALKNKPQDVFEPMMMSYSIIPKINSMGRLSDCVNANNAVRFLMLEDVNVILDVAKQINEINTLRKKKTSEMEKIALSSLTDREFEILADESFHEGIVGLLASRLASAKKKPFLVLTKNQDFLKGSMRSVEGLNLVEYFKDFSGFEKFGGHAQAAGVTIKSEKLDDLKHYIETHPLVLEESQPILCEMVAEEALSIQKVMEYRQLEPFGNGFEEILFYIENIQIQNQIPLAQGKYQKVVSTGGIEYLFFKSNLLLKIHDHMKVTGHINLSEFRGNVRVNVIVDEIVGDEIDGE